MAATRETFVVFYTDYCHQAPHTPLQPHKRSLVVQTLDPAVAGLGSMASSLHRRRERPSPVDIHECQDSHVSHATP
jgi:hypothetical protein